MRQSDHETDTTISNTTGDVDRESPTRSIALVIQPMRVVRNLVPHTVHRSGCYGLREFWARVCLRGLQYYRTPELTLKHLQLLQHAARQRREPRAPPASHRSRRRRRAEPACIRRNTTLQGTSRPPVSCPAQLK